MLQLCLQYQIARKQGALSVTKVSYVDIRYTLISRVEPEMQRYGNGILQQEKFPTMTGAGKKMLFLLYQSSYLIHLRKRTDYKGGGNFRVLR